VGSVCIDAMFLLKDINAVIRQVPFQYASLRIGSCPQFTRKIKGVRQRKHAQRVESRPAAKVHGWIGTKLSYLGSVILGLIGQFNFFQSFIPQIGQKEPADFQ